MNATWASILVVFRVLTLLAATASLVFVVSGFFMSNSEWGGLPMLLMCIFSLPDSYDVVVQSIRGPKPRPSPPQLLTV